MSLFSDFISNNYIVLYLFLFLFAIYWYLKNYYQFWAKQGIEGPEPKFIIGNAWEGLFTSVANLDMQWLNKFGDIYGTFFGLQPILTVTDPEIIKQIWVKDFQAFSYRRKLNTFHKTLNLTLFHTEIEYWRKIRPLVCPTFTSGKLKKMLPLMKASVNVFEGRLEKLCKCESEINIKFECTRFTMDVISRCAFATDINNANNKLADNLYGILNPKTWRAISAQMMPLFVNNFLGVRSLTNEDCSEYLFSVLKHLINVRKTEINGNHNDLMQALIDAGKEGSYETHMNDSTESHYINEDSELEFVGNLKEKQLTDNEIMAQSWIFFVAGFETTATTLSFCFYLLALNPSAQEKLFDEINNAFDENTEIEYEILSKLNYLDAVISETLRIFPPVVRLERTAVVDYELGELKLKKGQKIEASAYAVHHSKDNFENPEQFRPERFLPENRHLIKAYTFIPFGAGPRNCIGMKFALLELKLSIVNIVKKFRFVPNPKTDLNLDFTKILRLCHVKNLFLQIEKR